MSLDRDYCAVQSAGELWHVGENNSTMTVDERIGRKLRACESECDNDSDCEEGLICYQANGVDAYFPGCESGGTPLNNYDYCVNPSDSKKLLFMPTGGWTDSWMITDPLRLMLNAGDNVIRIEVPPGANQAPHIDYLRIEQPLAAPTSSATFRNPPHFMGLQLNSVSWQTTEQMGEQNIRDAQYQTEAVLDHYFYQPNVAPFICVRLIQRLASISNPGKNHMKSCVDAFRSGDYESGNETFGSGEYGDLEAAAAAILLHRDATDSTLLLDPSYGSLREPLLKVMALLRSMEYETRFADNLPGPPIAQDFQLRLYHLHEKIGQNSFEFPTGETRHFERGTRQTLSY